MAGENNNLLEAIAHIDPSACSYDEWLHVGMGLKEAGFPASAWEDWSSRDPRRYHSGECIRKWETFREENGGPPITGATVAKMAMDRGWRPSGARSFVRPDEALAWDAMISSCERDDSIFLDPAWVEPQTLQEPPDSQWEPVREIVQYLDTLFKPTDYVSYVMKSFERDGKRLPTTGYYDRTAGELIEELEKCGDDIGAALGDYNEEGGAWIRFNPVDGTGIGNTNVADFRYALVESDTMDIATQNALIRELELPVACLVYSGGKSLHAIVHIDAKDPNEYKKRVKQLYEICEKNGLEVDKQDGNPSRLSRLPGVWRNGHKQYLVATNIGKVDWAEWMEWVERNSDDLPDPENMAGAWDNLPELAQPLIEGILRQGHKMLLAGPSKAGKSYALIELCCAIAEGRPWLGFSCTQGRILYVNLELDRASCLHRFRDVYEAAGWTPQNLKNIDVWNLRVLSILI